MSSQTAGGTASPWWGGPGAGSGGATSRRPPAGLGARAVSPRPHGSAGALFERTVERRTEGRAAVALLAMWVGLWTVFALGVLAPATVVHAVREARPAESSAQAHLDGRPAPLP